MLQTSHIWSIIFIIQQEKIAFQFLKGIYILAYTKQTDRRNFRGENYMQHRSETALVWSNLIKLIINNIKEISSN